MSFTMLSMMGMDASMGEGSGLFDGIKNWLMGLPVWASSLIMTAVVVVAAALIGMIIGNMYSSVKYPNPEKQGALNPIVRIVFIVLILGCSVWLYFTFNPIERAEEPTEGEDSSYVNGGLEDGGEAVNGGTDNAGGGGVAVMPATGNATAVMVF